MSSKKIGWHPADIVAGLKKRGWSLRSLSIYNKLSPNTLSVVQSAQRPRLELIVANVLGEKPEKIWPDRYNDDGTINREYSHAK